MSVRSLPWRRVSEPGFGLAFQAGDYLIRQHGDWLLIYQGTPVHSGPSWRDCMAAADRHNCSILLEGRT